MGKYDITFYHLSVDIYFVCEVLKISQKQLQQGVVAHLCVRDWGVHSNSSSLPALMCSSEWALQGNNYNCRTCSDPKVCGFAARSGLWLRVEFRTVSHATCRW